MFKQMGLAIISNRSEGHEGNPDWDNPHARYDTPKHHEGRLRAASELDQRLQLANFNGAPLPRIALRESERAEIDPAILTVHSAAHLDGLRAASEAVCERRAAGEPDYLDREFGWRSAVSPGTFAAARGAVGACLDAIDHVLHHPGETAFALVWPAGHHAEGPESDGSPDMALGLCYLSNAAIAARYARDHAVQRHDDRPNRVVVIDIANFPANGTRKDLANLDYVTVIDLSRHSMSHPMYEAPNILSLEFKSRSARLEEMERLVREALMPLRTAPPDIIIFSLGLDLTERSPFGGAGLNRSGFYSFIRGTRMMFPEAAVMGVLEEGDNSDRWYSCLQPALLALHDDPYGPNDRAKLFKELRSMFIPTQSARNSAS